MRSGTTKLPGDPLWNAQVLNPVAGLLPFLPADDTVPREETRLRHRTLDLRYAC